MNNRSPNRSASPKEFERPKSPNKFVRNLDAQTALVRKPLFSDNRPPPLKYVPPVNAKNLFSKNPVFPNNYAPIKNYQTGHNFNDRNKNLRASTTSCKQDTSILSKTLNEAAKKRILICKKNNPVKPIIKLPSQTSTLQQHSSMGSRGKPEVNKSTSSFKRVRFVLPSKHFKAVLINSAIERAQNQPPSRQIKCIGVEFKTRITTSQSTFRCAKLNKPNDNRSLVETPTKRIKTPPLPVKRLQPKIESISAKSLAQKMKIVPSTWNKVPYKATNSLQKSVTSIGPRSPEPKLQQKSSLNDGGRTIFNNKFSNQNSIQIKKSVAGPNKNITNEKSVIMQNYNKVGQNKMQSKPPAEGLKSFGNEKPQNLDSLKVAPNNNQSKQLVEKLIRNEKLIAIQNLELLKVAQNVIQTKQLVEKPVLNSTNEKVIVVQNCEVGKVANNFQTKQLIEKPGKQFVNEKLISIQNLETEKCNKNINQTKKLSEVPAKNIANKTMASIQHMEGPQIAATRNQLASNVLKIKQSNLMLKQSLKNVICNNVPKQTNIVKQQENLGNNHAEKPLNNEEEKLTNSINPNFGKGPHIVKQLDNIRKRKFETKKIVADIKKEADNAMENPTLIIVEDSEDLNENSEAVKALTLATTPKEEGEEKLKKELELQQKLEQGLKKELTPNLEQKLEQGLKNELTPNLEQKLEQGLKNELSQKLEPKLEQGIKNEVSQKVESKLEQGLKNEVSQKLESKLEQGLQNELSQKMEQKLEQGLKNKLSQKLEPKLEHGLKHELSQIMEEKLEQELKNKLSQKLEPKLEQGLKNELSQEMEQRLEQRLKSNLSKEMEQRLEQGLKNKLSQKQEQKLEQVLKNELSENLEQKLQQGLKNKLSQKMEQKLEQGLKNNLSQELEQGLKDKLTQDLEQKLEQELNNEFSQKMDQKLKQELSNELLQEMEQKLEQMLENEMEQRVEKKLELELKQKQEYDLVQTLEQKLHQNLEQKIEDQLQPTLEQELQHKLEQELEHNLEYKQEQHVEQNLQPQLEQEVNLQQEVNLEQKPDQELNQLQEQDWEQEQGEESEGIEEQEEIEEKKFDGGFEWLFEKVVNYIDSKHRYVEECLEQSLKVLFKEKELKSNSAIQEYSSAAISLQKSNLETLRNQCYKQMLKQQTDIKNLRNQILKQKSVVILSSSTNKNGKSQESLKSAKSLHSSLGVGDENSTPTSHKSIKSYNSSKSDNAHTDGTCASKVTIDANKGGDSCIITLFREIAEKSIPDSNKSSQAHTSGAIPKQKSVKKSHSLHGNVKVDDTIKVASKLALDDEKVDEIIKNPDLSKLDDKGNSSSEESMKSKEEGENPEKFFDFVYKQNNDILSKLSSTLTEYLAAQKKTKTKQRKTSEDHPKRKKNIKKVDSMNDNLKNEKVIQIVDYEGESESLNYMLRKKQAFVKPPAAEGAGTAFRKVFMVSTLLNNKLMALDSTVKFDPDDSYFLILVGSHMNLGIIKRTKQTIHAYK